ncbi:hypothetical protein INT44_006066 [Umbelopsis vinacea]|uniref:Heterokaryon incompatibility domain-containing protein n=1 Tax=Umbelopsis vinacea TaxID=44442 RepID=A0A8H7Q048_9FUNG|nr:hypothetical protein INT44_006066 [Umbelopsis vinacea]
MDETPFDTDLEKDKQQEKDFRFLRFDTENGGDFHEFMSMLNFDDNDFPEVKQRSSSLHMAAGDGNYEVVKHLLLQDAAVNAKSDMLRTPLHLAAGNGHTEVVQLLLEHEAAVDAQDKFLDTPLHLAANEGHKDVVQLLLEHGAIADVKNECLETALHQAASNGHEKVVQLLLEHDAIVDAKTQDLNNILYQLYSKAEKKVGLQLFKNGARVNSIYCYWGLETVQYRAALNGLKELIQLMLEKNYMFIGAENSFSETALHRAAENGHSEVVRLLLEHGATVDAENQFSENALQLAAFNGHEDVVRVLFEYGAIAGAKSRYSETALHRAAAKGHKEMVHLLLEHSANIDAENHYDENALHYAAANGHKEVVQLLLEHGATVEVNNIYSGTALIQAAKNGHKEVVQLLIERGAIVNTEVPLANSSQYLPDDDVLFSGTALIQAAKNGHKEVVQLLLDHNANIDVNDELLGTALSQAAKNGHKIMVQQLLERGAIVDAEESISDTALIQAAKNGHKEIIQLLLKHGAIVDAETPLSGTALYQAAINGHREVVQMLVEHGAIVDAKSYDSEPALYCAIDNGHIEVVKLLLDYNAIFDGKDGRSRNVLYKAAMNGHGEIVSQLLSRRVNVDEKSEDGKTLLAQLTEIGDIAMARLLLDHDADIEAVDNDGRTPFLIAAKFSHIQILSLLISKGANMEASDKDSLTALHWSAKDDDMAVLSFLLKSKVIIEATTTHGDTALHLAASFNCFKALTVLIENGANIGAENKDGNTPIQCAILKGHIDMVYRLVSLGATNGKEDDDQSVLYFAIDVGQVKLVERAIDRIENTERREYQLNATLRKASMQGKTDLIPHLLDMGANIESCDDDGLSSLFLAARHPETISMLINHGACIEARSRKMQNLTVLHFYASLVQIEAMRILLNCGCNIHLTDDDNNTALHYMAKTGDCIGVAMLLERGADINTKNIDGETVLHIAIEEDFFELANFLIESDIDINAKTFREEETALHIAIYAKKTDLVSLLVRRHAYVDATDSYGRTALHVAAALELTEECASLIEHGANVNSNDYLNHTPLYYAVENCNPDVVKLLLKHNALVESWRNDLNLLHIAIRELDGKNGYYFNSRMVTVMQLLIEASVDIDDDILETVVSKFPELIDTFIESSSQLLSKKKTKMNAPSTSTDDCLEEVNFSNDVFEEFKDNSNTNIKDEQYEQGGQVTLAGQVPLLQSLTLLQTMSISDHAIRVIQSLLTCLDAKLFVSNHFFMLKLEGRADNNPPEWASHFDKMTGVIREQGLLIVQIPPKVTSWSVPTWQNDTHTYLRFIDAICVCRRSSTRLDEDVFSDVLGESEQKIATNLHAILIAGLSILSIAGGDELVEKLVKAVLDEDLDPIQSTSPSEPRNENDDWQVRNRRRCPCDSHSTHLPLSPVAAAKAVGIDIWRIRQPEVVTRVWDLDQDMLVDSIVASRVVFVTHRWNENETTYQNVMDEMQSGSQTVSNLSPKLRRIKEALQKHTRYVWVDTICIDKSNLSELDRAIRSMYKWYASCAAVVLDSGTSLKEWCDRGWCLQEGAAAGVLCGISKEGNLATIQELANEQRHDLCTLDLHLWYQPGNAVEIIARMDVRKTTYREDMVYALAGVFSIHLTLAYGEGFSSRERLFHELATKKGDVSFLSFQSTPTMFRNYLPVIGQSKIMIAKPIEASAPIMVSHFGVCFDVQLVEGSDASSVLKILKGWKDLSFAKGRSIGVDRLMEMAESQEKQSSIPLKLAIVHYIRSIILVETYGKDSQTGGAGRQIERCYRLQCCQIEEKEFLRLFSKDNENLVRIWLRDKPDGDRAKATASAPFRPYNIK